MLTDNLISLLQLYHDYQISVTCNTNLSFLSPQLLDAMIPVFNHLRISCDAVSRELYEQIRPGLSFQTFLDNLSFIKNYAPNIELMMETVIMRQNIEHIPTLIRFAAEHGFSQVSLNRLGSHPILNNQKDCLEHYPALAAHYLQQASRIARELGVILFCPEEWLSESYSKETLRTEHNVINAMPFRAAPQRVSDSVNYALRDIPTLYPTDALFAPGDYQATGQCDSLLGRTNLDLDGNVYACCMNTLCKTGNLFEMTDDTFYNAPALVLMRKMFYEGRVPCYCNHCSYVMNRTLSLAHIAKRDAVTHG